MDLAGKAIPESLVSTGPLQMLEPLAPTMCSNEVTNGLYRRSRLPLADLFVHHLNI